MVSWKKVTWVRILRFSTVCPGKKRAFLMHPKFPREFSIATLIFPSIDEIFEINYKIDKFQLIWRIFF